MLKSVKNFRRNHLSPRDAFHRRLICEPLEDRTLLSVGATYGPEYLPPDSLLDSSASSPYVASNSVGATSLALSGSPDPLGYSPQDIRKAYGIDSILVNGVLKQGLGQTIAIITAYDNPNLISSTDANYINSDLYQFDVHYGLPDPPSFLKLDQTGGTNYPSPDPDGKDPASWAAEAAMDVEWAHAIAPEASIVLIEATSTTANDIQIAINTARSLPGVSVISMSFGWPESGADSLTASDEQTMNDWFTTPDGHQGITFVSATGDYGSPGKFPAYSSNVLAVGGTSLTIMSGGGYYSESGWSGSGGGGSDRISEPSFQLTVQTSGKRQTPDVSFAADPGYGVSVYDSYDNDPASPWSLLGGTSLAAPCWAGLIAIANQIRDDNGLGSLDGPTQTLPGLYQLPPADFHDIADGNNGGFSAVLGYDLVTGLGSPLANLLVPDLALLKTASPPTVTGTSLTGGMLMTGDTSLSITFSQPVFGEATSNYELKNMGPDGLLGTTDDINVPLSVSYSDTTATLNFLPQPENVYRLTAHDAILDTRGNQFDGDANGTAGGDWTHDFVVAADASILSLTSPNSDVFQIAAGEFGSGELVQCTSNGTNNAFNGDGRLMINGALFHTSTSSAALADNGRTLLTGSGTFSGLNVSRKITVPNVGDQDFAQTIDSFTNPTNASITATVKIVGNLGSDAATAVFATSDGDTTLETTDQWIGTDGNHTPAAIHYIHGPKGLVPATIERIGDNIQWTYNITVPAGQTVQLGYFTIVSPTRAGAMAAANALVTDREFGGQAGAFLTAAQKAAIGNFQFPTAIATVSFDTQSPKSNDVLTATATKWAAQGKTVTLTFVWKVNDVVKKTTAATSALTDTFDLSATGMGNRGDVVTVSVTPNDGTQDGVTVSATATVVNALPSVSFATPTSPQSGNITIVYSLTDSDSDACSIVPEYSPDGGTTWKTATPGTGGDALTGLTSSAGGVSHTFVWNSANDVFNVGTSTGNTNVKIRITPSDSIGAGIAGTSNAFSVSNADTMPPKPNPSTWATVPFATGFTTISMTATTASDDNGVQYFFHCLTAGGHDSNWQSSPTYEDKGLLSNTTYSYQVKTRDLTTAHNEGTYSASASATTKLQYLTVTINQASTQVDPASTSPIQFTVVFNSPVSDFSTGDVSFSGTAQGTLVGAVTGSGTTYNVSVSGMTSGGTVVASIAAGKAHDVGNNANLASTSGDNCVSITPNFTLTGPAANMYSIGQSVPIEWTANFVGTNGKISLCYDQDATWNNGNEHWIEVEKVAATNGTGSYAWNTANVAEGTYYITGYLFSGGRMYTSYLEQPIILQYMAPPTFALTGPTAGTFAAGQSVPVRWMAGNVSSGSTVSLCYDEDTIWWNGNEHWIQVDQVAAANGMGNYAWNTAGMKSGTYYVAGYLWTGSAPVLSHLTQPIYVQAPPQPTFALTGPTAGTFAAGQSVTVQWTAGDVAAGNKISLCYDEDTAWWNGNEHWIEVDQVTAVNGAGSYTWNTAGLESGTYYVAGYLWNGSSAVFSHLAQPIAVQNVVPTFTMTGPLSDAFIAGQHVPIQWTAGNVSAGDVISLCYDEDASPWNGNEHWIEVDQVTAMNDNGNYAWSTADVAPGTYYLAGYLWDGASAVYSSLAQPIAIQAPAQPFTLLGPASISYQVGSAVQIEWLAADVTPGSKISLCYDEDTDWWNGNEHWIEVDEFAANNGACSTVWNTANMAPGSYYIAGYMYDGADGFTFSHLTRSITLTPGDGSQLTGGTLTLTLNNGGGLVKTGDGTLTMIGGTTLIGGTIITGGTLNINGVNAYDSTINFGSVTLTNGSSGTYNLVYTGEGSQGSFDNSGGCVVSTGSVTLTLNAGFSSNGVLAIDSGSGVLVLGGPGQGTSIVLDQDDTLSVIDTMGVGVPTSPDSLMMTELLLIAVEAKNRIAAVLGDAAAQNLSGVSFELADLADGVLAETSGRTVRIDRDAAGYGWFVDTTPQDDEEYSFLLAPGALQSFSPSPASQRADLLSAVMHEMGHELGLDQTSSTTPEWMIGHQLSIGLRRLPLA